MQSDVPAGRLEQKPDVKFFQQLADGAPVMIWMAGRDMGCFYFNRAWLDYRGRTLQEEMGNGWAEGVHPDDLERCVQHYVGSFEKRISFAMSYRLQDRNGEYRWILDRGAPHSDAEGGFLGFYGGCAETPGETAVSRIKELRLSLQQTREAAERVASVEAQNIHRQSSHPETLEAKTRQLIQEHRARQHAAAQMGTLAADMLVFDRIENGVCLV
ncbi:MAG TPA: PAS domain-containing protein [Verrucomicrobiae bacterium]|jgi:PAS domain S-box-containing protein|nr:PAS domain-containing protein [Verrucomicrobiae bacterium]